MRLFVVICVALTSCVAPTPPSEMTVSSERAYIIGPITRITDGGVLIEENPNESSGSAKAFLRVTADTDILSASGRKLTRTDLRVGQSVAAWTTGAIMESYPVQATARRIVVESTTGR